MKKLINLVRRIFYSKREIKFIIPNKLRNSKKEENNSKKIKSDLIEAFKKDIINIEFTKFKYRDNCSPRLILISKKKEYIIDSLVSEFSKMSLRPQVGIELEFYLRDDLLYEDDFYKLILDDCKAMEIGVVGIEKEYGLRQYEIKTVPYQNLHKLSNDIILIQEIVKNRANEINNFAIFDAQPYYYDCGSALQLNISLLDNMGNNIYSRILNEFGELEDNRNTLNSIGGLLEFIEESLVLFANEDDYKRYDFNLNKKLNELGKYTATSTITWGGNNRTVAIRLPSEKNLKMKWKSK